MSGPLLLSFREAARMLGVGRNGTLHELIKKGLLRPVTLLGMQKIPREQLEELARTGDGPTGSPAPRPSKRSKKSKSIADLNL